MANVIIYKNNEGGVSVIYPTSEALQLYGIEEIALKDVPHSKPFKIIDSAELPSREKRNQWDVDEADLTDGVGAEYSTFPDVQNAN
jgi:hypothetical protein